MQWKHFRADAKHSSEQWATTDRGWLHLALAEHPDVDRKTPTYRRDYIRGGLLCAGNYLKYPDGHVHASAYFLRLAAGGSSVQRINMERTTFDTTDEAAAAIESAVRAALAA